MSQRMNYEKRYRGGHVTSVSRASARRLKLAMFPDDPTTYKEIQEKKRRAAFKNGQLNALAKWAEENPEESDLNQIFRTSKATAVNRIRSGKAPITLPKLKCLEGEE